MQKINAKIVADSISPLGERITTFILTYPRFIHSELMTHRVFSRNSASSRAIPFNKMVKMVEEDPFIPIAWQKDHKGMQGTEYFMDEISIKYRRETWIQASRQAILMSKVLHESQEVTKQLCNRLLEPFMWHTVLLTATEFDNFFELRCPQYVINWYPANRPEALEPSCSTFKSRKDAIRVTDMETFGWSEIDWIESNESQAEIHIQALAEAMWDARKESIPKKLKDREWHIPFGDQINLPPTIPIDEGYTLEEGVQIMKAKIAVARCARLSYMTFDGEIDYKKDLKLYEQLLENEHLSPFEHIAICTDFSNINFEDFTHTDAKGNLWSGNFKNWIQYRQTLWMTL